MLSWLTRVYIKDILGGNPLKYIFVTHNESDESGVLSIFQKAYPNVITICSKLTARELQEFGYLGKTKVVSSANDLKDGQLQLKFIDYPSEVHLQNGLICLEENSGIMYSADLFLRYGNVGQLIKSKWCDEVERINVEIILNKQMLSKIKTDLLQWHPKIVAVGHGFCIEV